MAMKLAKLGYYGGNPNKVMKAPADMVLNIARYEVFESDLDAEYRKIYKESADTP